MAFRCSSVNVGTSPTLLFTAASYESVAWVQNWGRTQVEIVDADGNPGIVIRDGETVVFEHIRGSVFAIAQEAQTSDPRADYPATGTTRHLNCRVMVSEP